MSKENIISKKRPRKETQKRDPEKRLKNRRTPQNENQNLQTSEPPNMEILIM